MHFLRPRKTETSHIWENFYFRSNSTSILQQYHLHFLRNTKNINIWDNLYFSVVLDYNPASMQGGKIVLLISSEKYFYSNFLLFFIKNNIQYIITLDNWCALNFLKIVLGRAIGCLQYFCISFHWIIFQNQFDKVPLFCLFIFLFFLHLKVIP